MLLLRFLLIFIITCVCILLWLLFCISFRFPHCVSLLFWDLRAFFIGSVAGSVAAKTFYLQEQQLLCLLLLLLAINLKLDFQPNRPSAVCGHSLKEAPSVTVQTNCSQVPLSIHNVRVSLLEIHSHSESQSQTARD